MTISTCYLTTVNLRYFLLLANLLMWRFYSKNYVSNVITIENISHAQCKMDVIKYQWKSILLFCTYKNVIIFQYKKNGSLWSILNMHFDFIFLFISDFLHLTVDFFILVENSMGIPHSFEKFSDMKLWTIFGLIIPICLLVMPTCVLWNTKDLFGSLVDSKTLFFLDALRN